MTNSNRQSLKWQDCSWRILISNEWVKWLMRRSYKSLKTFKIEKSFKNIILTLLLNKLNRQKLMLESKLNNSWKNLENRCKKSSKKKSKRLKPNNKVKWWISSTNKLKSGTRLKWHWNQLNWKVKLN